MKQDTDKAGSPDRVHADGLADAAQFSPADAVLQEIDVLVFDAAFLEITLSFFGVKAFGSAKNLNIHTIHPWFIISLWPSYFNYASVSFSVSQASVSFSVSLLVLDRKLLIKVFLKFHPLDQSFASTIQHKRASVSFRKLSKFFLAYI